MRKFSSLLVCAILLMGTTQCDDSHSDLWDAIDDVNSRVDALEAKTKQINNELAALQTIVNALQQNLYIKSFDKTQVGYRFIMSDGSEMHIYHGNDGTNGKDGVNAPMISLKQDTDGNYYWTIDNDWLKVNGQKVRANGIDGINGADGKDGLDGKDGIDGENGQDGKDAVAPEAPQIRINETTKEWEISNDGGKTWTSTGVVAEGRDGKNGEKGDKGENGHDGEMGEAGKNGDSLFSEVNIEEEYVEFVLVNGTRFKVTKYALIFRITDEEGYDLSEKKDAEVFDPAQAIVYKVEANRIESCEITCPKGWSAVYDASKGEVQITAPTTVTNTKNEASGTVKFTLQVNTGSRAIEMIQTAVYKFSVEMAYELRILTFEDEDARFAAFDMYRNDSEHTITKWSDLIDEEQYGGELLYGNYAEENPYFWYDEGNTYLKHEFPSGWGSYVYWSGGHAISNYASNDIDETGNYQYQLTILGEKGCAGHNESKNFAVHFGYKDDSGYTDSQDLPSLYFNDGSEHIVDHMWVMPNNYALFCYTNGNDLTSNLSPEDYVKIIAIGFDSDENETGKTEIILANGDDMITSWTKWDLTSLGKVNKIEFNILGTSDNGYGFSQPAYFAYDDVAVRYKFEKQ